MSEELTLIQQFEKLRGQLNEQQLAAVKTVKTLLDSDEVQQLKEAVEEQRELMIPGDEPHTQASNILNVLNGVQVYYAHVIGASKEADSLPAEQPPAALLPPITQPEGNNSGDTSDEQQEEGNGN